MKTISTAQYSEPDNSVIRITFTDGATVNTPDDVCNRFRRAIDEQSVTIAPYA